LDIPSAETACAQTRALTAVVGQGGARGQRAAHAGGGGVPRELLVDHGLVDGADPRERLEDRPAQVGVHGQTLGDGRPVEKPLQRRGIRGDGREGALRGRAAGRCRPAQRTPP
jgi:hypothetical protein